MKYLVSYGGGITSAETLRRVLEKHGKENAVALFADVGQVRDTLGRVVDGEDDDLYRLMSEVEEELDFKITRIKSEKYGPGIWSVFFGERCIGNSLADACSRSLKRKVLIAHQKTILKDSPITICPGLDWQEPTRLERFRDAVAPWPVWFPLCDAPRRTKAQLILEWIGRGIEPPRLYEEGFAHNNCSGFCVKGGLWHFYNLWTKRPWIYAHHEAQETLFRATVKQYTVLKNQTMAELREKFEAGYVPVKREGGCRGTCVMPQKEEYAAV
jgi:hypothetical protein